MAEVIVHGEPDYRRFERAAAALFERLDSEKRLEYASKTTDPDDRIEDGRAKSRGGDL